MRTPWRNEVVVIVVVVVLFAAAACGGDSDDATSTTTTTAASTSTTPSTSPSSTGATSTTGPPATTAATSTTAPPSTSAPATTATSTSAPSEPTLPGEPMELFAQPGQIWSVVGVDRDDVLNVREAPGTDQEIIATLAPTADDVVTTGAARRLTRSIWYEVEVGDDTGWVNISFLALPGVVDDVTSQVVAELGGIPVAETLVELGEIVAATRASEDVESRIVVSVAPTVGDLGEITMDVIGLADDAAVGERLHVFAMEDESGEAFGLTSVEATILCGRGVSDEGLCA